MKKYFVGGVLFCGLILSGYQEVGSIESQKGESLRQFITEASRAFSASWQEELRSIDAQLKMLEDEKIRLKQSIARWDDAGNRWQFQQEMKQEAKRAFQKADSDRQQLQAVQQKIDALQDRKEEILKEHPEGYGT